MNVQAPTNEVRATSRWARWLFVVGIALQPLAWLYWMLRVGPTWWSAYHHGVTTGASADLVKSACLIIGIVLCMAAPFFTASPLRQKFMIAICQLGKTDANRGHRSLGASSLVLASRGRTPEGFTVNSRGWSEARATPPDTRRSLAEPRRGSPGTRSSTVREDRTTPLGWQAWRPQFPGVRSCLAYPRLFRDNPSGVGAADPGTDFRND